MNGWVYGSLALIGLLAGCASGGVRVSGSGVPRGADVEVRFTSPASVTLAAADSSWTVDEVRRARGRVTQVSDSAIAIRVSMIWSADGTEYYGLRGPVTVLPETGIELSVISERPAMLDRNLVTGSLSVVTVGLGLFLAFMFVLTVGGGFG